MKNAVVILLLLAITSGILTYLIRAKKRGQVCIGCPASKECAKKHGASCDCGKADPGEEDRKGDGQS